MNKFTKQTIPLAVIAMLSLIAAFSLSSPADAQSMRCSPYSIIEHKLTGPTYSEVKVATGLSGGHQTVLFVNPETGTFTLIVRMPNSVGCVLGSGTDWKFHKMPKASKPGRDS